MFSLQRFMFICAVVAVVALVTPAASQDTVRVSEDAFVINGTPDGNFGTTAGGDGIRVRGSSPTGTAVRHAYFKFDLTSYSGTFTKAVFGIWLDRAVNSTTGNLDRLDCYDVADDSWTETGITWNNAPAPGTTKLFEENSMSRRATADNDTVYTWDVSAYVTQEFGIDKIVSFYMVDDSSNGTDLRIFSRETGDSVAAFLILSSTTAVSDEGVEVPGTFILTQNYPNPFNPTTQMAFTVPSRGHASLKVYSVLGVEIATLFQGHLEAGSSRSVTFDAEGLPSGIYLAVLRHNGVASTRRMVLAR